MKNRAVGAILMAVAASVPVLSWPATIRLHGASTALEAIVRPHQEAVHKLTGHELVVVGKPTGKALADLAEGRADAALVTETLDMAVVSAAAAGRKIEAKSLRMVEMRKDEIVFVVHRSNPVSALTWEQLADIHAGRIANWKKVGGRDAPIVIYAGAAAGGARALVSRTVMRGAVYSPGARSVTSVARVALYVSMDPDGIGAIGREFADDRPVKIVQTKALERPLGFITVGAPSRELQEVIDAFAAEMAKAKAPKGAAR